MLCERRAFPGRTPCFLNRTIPKQISYVFPVKCEIISLCIGKSRILTDYDAKDLGNIYAEVFVLYYINFAVDKFYFSVYNYVGECRFFFWNNIQKGAFS